MVPDEKRDVFEHHMESSQIHPIDSSPDVMQESFRRISTEEIREKKRKDYADKGTPDTIIELLLNKSYKKEQIERIIRLPWNSLGNRPIVGDYTKAKACLNKEHVGMSEVKARIMDYICTDFRDGAALLLVGPPGVGKTSIAVQIAKAINRKYYEIALSGVASSHEITGADPTFNDSTPGEIIRAIEYTETFYPLIILDEIDKVGRSKEHGDPQNALLEVLDTNRSSFRDRFLNIPLDITDIVFIATANNLSEVSPVLRDRLEIIEIGGYSKSQKKSIMKTQVIPAMSKRILDDPTKILQIDDSAIDFVVNRYVTEPGIREIRNHVDRICRRANKEYLETNQKIIVSEDNIRDYLGSPKRLSLPRDAKPVIGSANTSVLLSTKYAKTILIQTEISAGNGTIIATGGIEGVARKAVDIARTVVRHYSAELKIPHDYFSKMDIHVHSEYQMELKSTLSASFAVFMALLSNVLKSKIPLKFLFVGELFLDGDVRHTQNLNEYLDAAIDSNLTTAFISYDNIIEDESIIEKYKDSIAICPVRNAIDAFKKVQEEFAKNGD